MKWSVTLTDRLGLEMLTVLEIKGQVLHRVRLHVKVPGLLLNLNALLTKKLPKFLSRLNEMSGGKENMCLVSVSLLRILKFLNITFLIARFCIPDELYNLASAMLNSKIRPRAVVGYGVKIFHPSLPNYVTRSPGRQLGNSLEMESAIRRKPCQEGGKGFMRDA